MKVANGKQVNTGIGIAVVIVLVIAALSVWQYRRIRSMGTEVRHIDSVLYQTGELSVALLKDELDDKNFELTRDSSYLARDSAGGLLAKIGGLRSLAVNDRDVRSRIDSLVAFFGGGWTSNAPLTDRETTRREWRSPVLAILGGIMADEHLQLDQLRAANQVRASELQWTLWVLSAAVVVLAVVIFRKIRLELGEARVARQSSEEKYKMLFFKGPLARWIYDEETLRFLEVNEAAVRMYGYTQEEFRKLTLADIRPQEDVGRLMAELQEVHKNSPGYPTGHRRHLRKNGEVMDVEVTVQPVELDGRRARMVAIVDITERRRYERQLEKLNGDLHRLNADLQRLNADLGKRAEELAASNAELERFAYVASHDLQEPLRMVSSFLQLLQKKYGSQLDDKAGQYIYYAVDGAERMKALIMDLLEYSRLGRAKEGFDWVDCGEVMTEVSEVFREQVAAARAKLEIGRLPRVWGDKVQMTRLFQNLLSNALKYAGKEPPVIRITAEEQPAYWEFRVADNGIMIDPQFFDKVFVIFQRLHNKNEYSGTGIGLAICKKIVERHGGKIWVESGPDAGSTPEGGSTFHFTINKKI
ncbi:MAG TPA: ATP-binding protein [Puia sp.]|nr:ATP-binding protein [Puia sp.]